MCQVVYREAASGINNRLNQISNLKWKSEAEVDGLSFRVGGAHPERNVCRPGFVRPDQVPLCRQRLWISTKGHSKVGRGSFTCTSFQWYAIDSGLVGPQKLLSQICWPEIHTSRSVGRGIAGLTYG